MDNRQMKEQKPTPSEQPRSEPEIIPPGQTDDPWLRGRRTWSFNGGRGNQRIYFTKLGPFSIFLLVAGIALAAALLLIVMLGAFLIWIPIVGLVIAAAMLSGLLRGLFRR
jgi:hypothetical protein